MCPRRCLSVLLLGIQLTLANGAGIRCLQCDNIPTPYDCNLVTTCNPGEVCFVDSYVSRVGITTYNVGCRQPYLCAKNKRELKSRRSSVQVCSECCGTEFCNNQGCGIKLPDRSTRGPICFTCRSQAEENDCRDITQCDLGEVCVVERNVAEHHYHSRCIFDQQCDTIQRQTAGFESLPHPSGVVDHCPVCCDVDFCNDNCSHNVTSVK